eukprot:760249-Hanusia_phi.AAC.2
MEELVDSTGQMNGVRGAGNSETVEGVDPEGTESAGPQDLQHWDTSHRLHGPTFSSPHRTNTSPFPPPPAHRSSFSLRPSQRVYVDCLRPQVWEPKKALALAKGSSVLRNIITAHRRRHRRQAGGRESAGNRSGDGKTGGDQKRRTRERGSGGRCIRFSIAPGSLYTFCCQGTVKDDHPYKVHQYFILRPMILRDCPAFTISCSDGPAKTADLTRQGTVRSDREMKRCLGTHHRHPLLRALLHPLSGLLLLLPFLPLCLLPVMRELSLGTMINQQEKFISLIQDCSFRDFEAPSSPAWPDPAPPHVSLPS